MNKENNEAQETEVMAPSAVEMIANSEINQQIATAHKFPRSMERFKKTALAIATIDDETAESCIYFRPVGKDKDTGEEKFAEGMSVRMAEIVGAAYGNLRVAATIIEQTERYVVARGMAIDLESNFASSSEVIESTVDKFNKPYSERMRIVTAKAALAKARRDATFQVVPRALAKPIETACRKIIAGDEKSLGERRQKIAAWIGKLGIPPARVYATLGIAGESEITADHIILLNGIRTAIRDGDIKVDDAFPPEKKDTTQSIGDMLEGKKSDKKAAAKTEAPPPAAEPTKEEIAAAKVVQDKLRKTILTDLEGRILDGKTTEAALIMRAKKEQMAPWDNTPDYLAAGIGELPTDTLAKLAS